MGKQRIAELMAQLKDTQAQDAQNAAAIYTVAHMAVDELEDQSLTLPEVAPEDFSKAALQERYGPYNDCRRAAKQLGIRFCKTPSWAALEAAFRYRAACLQLVHTYLASQPSPHLGSVVLEIPLDGSS